MATNPFRINGLEGLQRKLKQFPAQLKAEIDAELHASAKTIVRNAQRDAPVDVGGLRMGIHAEKVGELKYEVYSDAAYSAFIEFGTRTKVQIPAGYEAYAAQFKGMKGSGGIDAFFLNILEWVRHKGISGTYSVKSHRRTGSKAVQADQDKKAAYAIMLSILKNGINPHPFFIKNVIIEKDELIKRIKRIVTDINK